LRRRSQHPQWERITRAWLADHPGKTRSDFDRLMSCAATGKEYRAMAKWWDENVKMTPVMEPQKVKRKDELKPAGSRFNHPRTELEVANAKIASMRVEIRELQAKLKAKVEMPKDVVALQRQLMAAKTELQNLKVHRTQWRQSLDKLRDELASKGITITKAQYALLQKAFHPDPEHDTATPERKQQLLDAAQVFYALKFNVPGRKEKPKPSR
jgi:septal ring factor EnvC (AmiA/AmiB activator)